MKEAGTRDEGLGTNAAMVDFRRVCSAVGKWLWVPNWIIVLAGIAYLEFVFGVTFYEWFKAGGCQ